jgi:DNA-binding transcriptional LysR family regulator
VSTPDSLAAFDLNLLVVLDAVLDERSVARAAKRLHVTPPAISNSLARLRTQLGDPLVIRSGRGIVPTPRALALAPALAQALRALAQVVDGDAFDPATTRRQFTLAVADAGQVVRLPKIAALMAAELPRARLRVVGIDTLVATGGLAGTTVDAAIGVAEKLSGDHTRALYDERTVLVARRDHPAGARVSKAALGALRHVDVHVTPGLGNVALTAAFAGLGIPREVAIVVPTFAAAAAVVAATDLVACLPASVVAMLGRRLGLCTITSPVPAMTQPIHLVWHARTHADPGQRAFRALIVRSVPPARGGGK